MSSGRVANVMQHVFVWCPSVLYAIQPGVWSGRITFSHALLWLLWFILLGGAIEFLWSLTAVQRTMIVELDKSSDAFYKIAAHQHEILLTIKNELQSLSDDDFVPSDQIREAFERMSQCFDEKD